MTNLVTVIMPCYNQANFLTKSIQSVIDQTYSNLEIIVVDDGSTDQTAQIVKDIIAKNPDYKIKYLFKKHSGPSETRNLGIKMAQGKYIQLLDGDDYLAKNKIKKQVDFFDKNNQIDVVYGSFRYEYLDKSAPKLKSFVIDLGRAKDQLALLLANGGLMPIHCFLIRKEVFNRAGWFNIQRDALEDLDLWIRCVQKGVKFTFQEDNQASIYVLKNVSLSRNKLKMYSNYAKILEDLNQTDLKEPHQALVNQKLTEVYMFLSIIESIHQDKLLKNKYYQLMLNQSSTKFQTKINYIIHKFGYDLLKKKDILSYEK